MDDCLEATGRMMKQGEIRWLNAIERGVYMERERSGQDQGLNKGAQSTDQARAYLLDALSGSHSALPRLPGRGNQGVNRVRLEAESA